MRKRPPEKSARHEGVCRAGRGAWGVGNLAAGCVLAYYQIALAPPQGNNKNCCRRIDCILLLYIDLKLNMELRVAAAAAGLHVGKATAATRRLPQAAA